MLMSKVKLEELRGDLYRSIEYSAHVPYYFDYSKWTPDQLQQLEAYKSMLQQQTTLQLKTIVDEILNAVYTHEDLESDLKLTNS